MSSPATSLVNLSVESKRELVRLRRAFHKFPELSGQEVRTARLIETTLRAAGISDVKPGVAGNGVVAWLKGEFDGPSILLRADMDALPLQERDRGQEYISLNEGVHHACGHDGHTAILLEVAQLLVTLKPLLHGSVVFVFQPAEERGGGAHNVLVERPWPSSVAPVMCLALHIWNDIPAGGVDVRAGLVMGGSQGFQVRLVGPGGHGASPHECPDPIVWTGVLINALQTVVSRTMEPASGAVVSLGVVRGGQDRSIIASEVRIEGTLRYRRVADLEKMRDRIDTIVNNVAQMGGLEATVTFATDGYSPCVNDPRLSAVVKSVAREVLGDQNVSGDLVLATADDMSEFLTEIQGCYFFVGGSNPSAGISAGAHSPSFDFDESALVVGATVLLNAVLHELSG